MRRENQNQIIESTEPKIMTNGIVEHTESDNNRHKGGKFRSSTIPYDLGQQDFEKHQLNRENEVQPTTREVDKRQTPTADEFNMNTRRSNQIFPEHVVSDHKLGKKEKFDSWERSSIDISNLDPSAQKKAAKMMVDVKEDEFLLRKLHFRQSFRKTGFLGKFFYTYATGLIDAINNDEEKVMRDEMIEDMTLSNDETEHSLKFFEDNLKRREAENLKLRRRHRNYYLVVRGAVWDTFGQELMLTSVLYFASEFFGILYTSYLQQLIEFIKDEEDDSSSRSAQLLAIFGGLMSLQALFRNYYIFKGYLTAVKMRKTFVAALFNKVSRLSMKALTQTNSGKLITIVGGDIQAIERPLALVSVIFAAPFVNLVALVVIWMRIGWQSSLITLAMSVLSLGCQHLVTKFNKHIKGRESVCNDERLKFVGDMINGARTIKSYGWENHYLRKIMGWRQKQVKYVTQQGIIGLLGVSLFENVGLLVLALIVLPQWKQGEYLDEASTISLMAMLFYIFLSVNSLVYYALSTLQQFLAIIERLSQVFELEEFTQHRKIYAP